MAKSLKMLIIGCHKDKKLLETLPDSAYDFYIQAGAAMTDERIYPVNDHDGFADSISDRNPRYSEMTAVYWAYKNLDSDYVGIEHYRRRFVLSDDEIRSAMDAGTDIITLRELNLGKPMVDKILEFDFASAVYHYSDIMKRLRPEDSALTEEILLGDRLRPCNMNIMKLEVFREYCEWLFPVLDEFYRIVPRKRDSYLCRDVGFVAERLSYVFVEKMRRRGLKIMESSYHQYKSQEGSGIRYSYSDLRELEKAMDESYRPGRFNDCKNILNLSYKDGDEELKKNLERYFRVFNIYDVERKYCEMSLFEYLPDEVLVSLNRISTELITLGGQVFSLFGDPVETRERSFNDYVKKNDFSGVAIAYFVSRISRDRAAYEYVAAVLNEGGMSEKAVELMSTI